MTKLKHTIPKSLLKAAGMDTRQWKGKKRRELKAVIEAWKIYRLGSAYCPGYPDDNFAASSALRRLKLSHTAKAWGR